MKFKTILAVFLLPLACVAQKQNYTLKVTISNVDPKTKIYLAYQADGKRIIDSAMASEGTFTLNNKIERPLNATLVLDNEGIGIQQLMLKSKKGGDITALKFYIHPGVFSMNTDKDLRNTTFTNSPINTDNQQLAALLKNNEDEQMHISNQLRAGGFIRKGNDPSPDKVLTTQQSQMVNILTKQLDSLQRQTRPIYKQFARTNPNSYVALLALQNYAGSSPNLDEIMPIYESLSPAVKNAPAAKEYYKFLIDRKNLIAGVPAPLFIQTDTAGRPVNLASFKGKYVLLDFWASWCGPCRANNPALVKIYNDFKDKNFTILGVSLDEAEGKKSWLKAIKDDGLTWTQVSDLKHWDNQVVKLYSVSAIPQNFLIDPNGLIVAKDLDTEALRKKLQEILPR